MLFYFILLYFILFLFFIFFYFSLFYFAVFYFMFFVGIYKILQYLCKTHKSHFYLSKSTTNNISATNPRFAAYHHLSSSWFTLISSTSLMYFMLIYAINSVDDRWRSSRWKGNQYLQRVEIEVDAALQTASISR